MVETINWLERLGKWRALLTGRLLGTRLIYDPQARGARDLFDKLNVLAAEGSTVSGLLTSRGVFTPEEFAGALKAESPAQADAVGDLFETLLQLRAEQNAVTHLLMRKGLLDADEFRARLMKECEWLCARYEDEFRGFRATDHGLEIYDARLAAQTARGWPK